MYYCNLGHVPNNQRNSTRNATGKEERKKWDKVLKHTQNLKT